MSSLDAYLRWIYIATAKSIGDMNERARHEEMITCVREVDLHLTDLLVSVLEVNKPLRNNFRNSGIR